MFFLTFFHFRITCFLCSNFLVREPNPETAFQIHAGRNKSERVGVGESETDFRIGERKRLCAFGAGERERKRETERKTIFCRNVEKTKMFRTWSILKIFQKFKMLGNSEFHLKPDVMVQYWL